MTMLDWLIIAALVLVAGRVLLDIARGVARTAGAVAVLAALGGAAWWFWLR